MRVAHVQTHGATCLSDTCPSRNLHACQVFNTSRVVCLFTQPRAYPTVKKCSITPSSSESTLWSTEVGCPDTCTLIVIHTVLGSLPAYRIAQYNLPTAEEQNFLTYFSYVVARLQVASKSHAQHASTCAHRLPAITCPGIATTHARLPTNRLCDQPIVGDTAHTVYTLLHA